MNTERRYGLCPLCDSVCGLRFEVEGRRLVSVRGDELDPFSRGHACPKGLAWPELHHDPDRLTRPLVKVAGRWQEIGFDEAFDLAGRRLAGLQSRHGRDAVGLYYGNPTGHDYKAMFAVLAWAGRLGSRNLFSSNSIDAHPRMLVSLLLYGNQALLPVPDIERTGLLVVQGANPAISHGSVMTAPDTRRRLKEIRDRGGRIVVLDPRFTRTAALGDRHLPVRPGTDALLLLSVVHELARLDLVAPRAHRIASGVDALLELADRFPPERTAAATGVPAAEVTALTRSFASADRAVWYGRMGTSTQAFGCLSTWLIDAVNLLAGRFDRPGGLMFATPAVDLAAIGRRLGQTGRFGRWTSRVGGLPEFNGEIPVAALADEIETPGSGQLRGLLVFAGNPALSNPNGRRLERALERLEFMVSVDPYLNETSRLADLVIPPRSPLENAHYPVLELSMGVRDVARYAAPVLPPEPGRPDDFTILVQTLRALERARGGGARLVSAGLGAFRRFVGSGRLLDLLLRLGPHPLRLSDLKAAEHGIDLGPLRVRGRRVLATADRRVQLVPDLLAGDVDRLEASLKRPRRPDELLLVSRRELRGMNSWLHNSPRLTKGRERCTLQVHPADASARGVEDGALARLGSRIGSVEVRVEVTPEMMPGVVSMPFGWGHDRPGVRLRVASARPGVSMNDVTDERLFDAVSGTSVLDGIPVRLEAQGRAARS